MANQLCFQCFKVKGEYEVCPHCGYKEGTAAKQACQLAPGTVLSGRYIIGTSIGFGGFGITYKAYDTVLGIVVAIKEFYPAGLVSRAAGEVKIGIFSGDKEAEFKRQLARFLEEARNMAIFSKEKDIVNVFDFFEENQTAYIIMEFIEGQLLKERLKEGRMEAEEAEGYMMALLDALAKVHYHGIIHKDVSPDNIFLTGKDSIKLFDFGAAKFQGTGSERSGDVVVKAGYTPLEQYRAKNKQGPFMDVYAAGAVFYEMLAGEKPLEAPDRAIEDELKKFSEFDLNIDETIERIIWKAMAIKPELRFQTAEQFKNALISRKKVDLPEEALKKIKLRRRILGIGSVSAAAVLSVVLLLSQTVFSGRGKLDIAKIKEDSLSVWLLAKDEESGQKMKEDLEESMQATCPQITLEAEAITEKEYAARLQEAAKNQALPDVFCGQGVVEAQMCENLMPLLRTIETDEYFYLGDLLENGGAAYQIPTAVQVGVVYQISSKEREENEAALMEDLVKDEAVIYADETQAFAKFGAGEGQEKRLAGDLSDMEQIKEVTVDKLPPVDFSVSPVLKEGRLLGIYKNCYSVNAASSENKKKAGMVLISMLLSEGMQSSAYMDNDEGIPLNKEVYKDYAEYKMTTYLAFLKDYPMDDIWLEDGEELCRIMRMEGTAL